MRYIRPAIATTCVGQAVAVGALLLAGGTPGRRRAGFDLTGAAR